MEVIGSRFRDDVDNAARSPPELGSGSGSNDLKFLDGVEWNVDRSALSTQLFAKEPVVIVTTVQTDVIENSALAGERNFISIRTLDDADSRGQRQ